MLVKKSELTKTLRSIGAFDSSASPYLGMQLEGEPSFYRSSSQGFIQSEALGLGKITYVYINQLRDSLQALDEEQLEVSAEGVCVKISSINLAYTSEIRISTIQGEKTGLKHHDVGDVKIRLEPSIFHEVDVRPFPCAAPPLLVEGQLILPTLHGIVMWCGPDSLKSLQLHPREIFLRLLSPATREVCITENGYWGVVGGGLMAMVKGHLSPASVYDGYKIKGTGEVALPARRLASALSTAVSISEDSRKIDICPTQGVVTRDVMGNQSRFSLGATGWNKFSIPPKTAKMIADTLHQNAEDTAVLSLVPIPGHDTRRVECGKWSVAFKIF